MKPLDSRYSWFRLTITLIIAVVGNVGIWIVVVVLPLVQAEFGIARADASLPYTMTMAGFAVGNLVIGRAVDRYGISPSLICGAISVAGGFALAALSRSVPVLTASHLLIGFGTAACFGPLIADISHWFMRRRGIAVAVTASGNYLSGVIWACRIVEHPGGTGMEVRLLGIGRSLYSGFGSTRARASPKSARRGESGG